jgi:hypothetical protein
MAHAMGYRLSPPLGAPNGSLPKSARRGGRSGVLPVISLASPDHPAVVLAVAPLPLGACSGGWERGPGAYALTQARRAKNSGRILRLQTAAGSYSAPPHGLCKRVWGSGGEGVVRPLQSLTPPAAMARGHEHPDARQHAEQASESTLGGRERRTHASWARFVSQTTPGSSMPCGRAHPRTRCGSGSTCP